jgi:Kdo2-lipid IVA lauroyltransferase/acyltransferase
MYTVFYIFIWLVAWLPLRVLYVFSDFFYLIIYYIVGYRKKIARKNIEKSFPEKSKKELRRIERRFFRYFCDLFVETFYEMHMSEKEVLRRMDLGDIDLIMEQYAKGRSIMLMSAHYGNWEWASAFALKLPEDMQIYNVYKRLNNKKFDNFMLEIRSKFKGQSVEIHNLLRTMVNLRKEGRVSVFGMISDQSPWVGNINHWNTFLNQDTPVITGTEQLAKKFDYPVFYIHIHRVKRGYYKFEYIPVSLEPTLTSEFEISNKYMEILEKKIQAAPEYWLWTHNRWKHSHLRKKISS